MCKACGNSTSLDALSTHVSFFTDVHACRVHSGPDGKFFRGISRSPPRLSNILQVRRSPKTETGRRAGRSACRRANGSPDHIHYLRTITAETSIEKIQDHIPELEVQWDGRVRTGVDDDFGTRRNKSTATIVFSRPMRSPLDHFEAIQKGSETENLHSCDT